METPNITDTAQRLQGASLDRGDKPAGQQQEQEQLLLQQLQQQLLLPQEEDLEQQRGQQLQQQLLQEGCLQDDEAAVQGTATPQSPQQQQQQEEEEGQQQQEQQHQAANEASDKLTQHLVRLHELLLSGRCDTKMQQLIDAAAAAVAAVNASHAEVPKAAFSGSNSSSSNGSSSSGGDKPHAPFGSSLDERFLGTGLPSCRDRSYLSSSQQQEQQQQQQQHWQRAIARPDCVRTPDTYGDALGGPPRGAPPLSVGALPVSSVPSGLSQGLSFGSPPGGLSGSPPKPLASPLSRSAPLLFNGDSMVWDYYNSCTTADEPWGPPPAGGGRGSLTQELEQGACGPLSSGAAGGPFSCLGGGRGTQGASLDRRVSPLYPSNSSNSSNSSSNNSSSSSAAAGEAAACLSPRFRLSPMVLNAYQRRGPLGAPLGGPLGLQGPPRAHSDFNLHRSETAARGQRSPRHSLGATKGPLPFSRGGPQVGVEGYLDAAQQHLQQHLQQHIQQQLHPQQQHSQQQQQRRMNGVCSGVVSRGVSRGKQVFYYCPSCLEAFPSSALSLFAAHVSQRGHVVQQLQRLRGPDGYFQCPKCTCKGSDLLGLLRHWHEGGAAHHGQKILKHIRTKDVPPGFHAIEPLQQQQQQQQQQRQQHIQSQAQQQQQQQHNCNTQFHARHGVQSAAAAASPLEAQLSLLGALASSSQDTRSSQPLQQQQQQQQPLQQQQQQPLHMHQQQQPIHQRHHHHQHAQRQHHTQQQHLPQQQQQQQQQVEQEVQHLAGPSSGPQGAMMGRPREESSQPLLSPTRRVGEGPPGGGPGGPRLGAPCNSPQQRGSLATEFRSTTGSQRSSALSEASEEVPHPNEQQQQQEQHEQQQQQQRDQQHGEGSRQGADMVALVKPHVGTNATAIVGGPRSNSVGCGGPLKGAASASSYGSSRVWGMGLQQQRPVPLHLQQHQQQQQQQQHEQHQQTGFTFSAVDFPSLKPKPSLSLKQQQQQQLLLLQDEQQHPTQGGAANGCFPSNPLSFGMLLQGRWAAEHCPLLLGAATQQHQQLQQQKEQQELSQQQLPQEQQPL